MNRPHLLSLGALKSPRLPSSLQESLLTVLFVSPFLLSFACESHFPALQLPLSFFLGTPYGVLTLVPETVMPQARRSSSAKALRHQVQQKSFFLHLTRHLGRQAFSDAVFHSKIATQSLIHCYPDSRVQFCWFMGGSLCRIHSRSVSVPYVTAIASTKLRSRW